jgi:hypothetical protein
MGAIRSTLFTTLTFQLFWSLPNADCRMRNSECRMLKHLKLILSNLTPLSYRKNHPTLKRKALGTRNKKADSLLRIGLVFISILHSPSLAITQYTFADLNRKCVSGNRNKVFFRTFLDRVFLQLLGHFPEKLVFTKFVFNSDAELLPSRFSHPPEVDLFILKIL